MANIQTVHVGQPAQATGRLLRRPQHSFQIGHKPFQIQPFALAPVLPGETLKNALIQARVVTRGLKNSLCGWWYEMYLFYVKHRDMPNAQHFQNMVLTVGYDLGPAKTATPNADHYHSGGVDWVEQCLRAVVPFYFRDEGEPYDAGMLDGLPMAKVNGNNWTDSLLLDSAFPQGGTIAGGSSASATELLIEQWQLMREMKLTTATYEDFLRSYGVRPDQAVAPNKPELIRYVRDWNYPSNTIDPATGNPTSAMSWSISERADKDRYFPEPGFIFGVAVARPKIYYGGLKGNAAQLLDDAMSWLPAVMADNPETSLKKLPQDGGGLLERGGATNGAVWVDVRDLFLYGDQFCDGETANGQLAGFPDPVSLNRKYPANGALIALAADETTPPVTFADGVLALQIAGHQRDHT